MRVNWVAIEIVNAKGRVTYRNSFVTDLPVDRDRVAELAAHGPVNRPYQQTGPK